MDVEWKANPVSLDLTPVKAVMRQTLRSKINFESVNGKIKSRKGQNRQQTEKRQQKEKSGGDRRSLEQQEAEEW